MKLIFLLFSCFLFLASEAQSATGYANTITLDEKDGYSGNLYVVFQTSPEGNRYSASFDGNIYINSNNSEKKIEALSGLPGVNGCFHFPEAGTCWYYNSHRVAILKADTLYSVIPTPSEMYYYYLTASGRLFYFDVRKNGSTLYEFAGTGFRKLKNIRIDTINLQKNFVTDTRKNIWRFENEDKQLKLYRFNEQLLEFEWVKSYPSAIPLYVRGMTDENNFICSTLPDGRILHVAIGIPKQTDFGSTCGIPGNICTNSTYYPYAVTYDEQGIAKLLKTDSTINEKILQVQTDDPITHLQYEKGSNSWLGFTNNKPLQVFSHLKKYPNTFGNNSSGIFALCEDDKGRIWAGGYKGGLAIIDRQQTKLTERNISFLNGSTSLNQYQYLICENKNAGLQQYDVLGRRKPLSNGTLGYYVTFSRDKKFLYYGTANYAGLWLASMASVEKGKPEWKKIDKSKGLSLFNILTITEDSMGRVWCGHPKRGIAVYDPNNQKANTWLLEKKETPIGSFASMTDKYGTVWLGTKDKGLWYYNDYSKPASPASCKPFPHPLLENEKAITALAVYQDWLVIAASDKMLLLRLDSFHKSQQIILRYLNPREAGFTAVTEQNTMLVSQQDSSIWFSTGDMLYQWKINDWLNHPTYKVRTEILFNAGIKHQLTTGKTNNFPAGTQNFDIQLLYHSTDLLPRYSRAALIKDGESIQLSEAGLQDFFSFKNIGSGQYSFIVEIFEADGTTSRFLYPIVIRKFLWQQWWFWALLAVAGSGIVILLINLRKKKQLAEQRALAKEAQLLAFKSEQEKKLADLQLISLSSQFRPHFILNALNTIGARMDNHPEAETVLSRLGESVNLIFNHASRQQILHPLLYEWKLVQNIIDIHRLMYLKQMESQLPAPSQIGEISSMSVPMGLLQIPVENALLHGLSNRLSSPWLLIITCEIREKDVVFNITDNGVGRKKSSTLSNFSKHGTGTKNLNETISIINSMHHEQISMIYEDDIYHDENGPYGTRVIITIPKGLTYAN